MKDAEYANEMNREMRPDQLPEMIFLRAYEVSGAMAVRKEFNNADDT